MSYTVPTDEEIGFVLGNEVEDEVTKLRGIAIQMSDHLNGCIQFSIQPPSKDNKIPDSTSIDYQRLKKVGEGVKNKSEGWPECDFVLGNVVTDKITGFVGIATMRIRDISGECFYFVSPRVDKNEYSKGHFFTYDRLLKVDDGVFLGKKLAGGPDLKFENFNR